MISEYIHAISLSLLSVKSVKPTALEKLSFYCNIQEHSHNFQKLVDAAICKQKETTDIKQQREKEG
jgi:hypothetical protein